MALELYRIAALPSKSLTPFSDQPYLIASRTYYVWGILIVLNEMVAVMPFLEVVYMPSPDGLPAVNRSCVRHKNRILREERGDGGCVVFVDGLVILLAIWQAQQPAAEFERSRSKSGSALLVVLGSF